MMNYGLKLIFRIFIFPIICLLGLQNLIFRTKNKHLILTYHGITTRKNLNYNGRHFSKRIFEKHLRYFKKHFNIVRLDDIFEMHRNNAVPQKKTIAITFDDGFENNYSIALPLLQKYNIPATFFISAVCAEDSKAILWPDVVDIIGQSIKEQIHINSLTFDKQDRYDFFNHSMRITLSDFVKQKNSKDREVLINNLKDKYQFYDLLESVDPEIWRLMTKEQIEEIKTNKLIEIGSHGYLHYNLANIEEEIAFEDLKKSKDLIENITKNKVYSLAFPDGNYNKKIIEFSLKLGFTNLCAVSYQNKNDFSEKNLLPRYGMSATTNFYSNIIFLHKAFINKGF